MRRLRSRETAREDVATVVTGLVAAFPVFVSLARAVSDQWTPLGDRAEIAARAFDVFSSHSPLIGHWSAVSGVIGQGAYAPGPLLYWVLAVPARIGGAAPAVAVAIVNVACVIGAVAVARRRGGRALMVATAVALLLMSASLVSSTWSDIWEPSAALMPLVLLVFAGWSVACGDAVLLPLLVLVASLVAQCHLAYVLPAVGIVVVAIAGLALAHRRSPLRLLRRWVGLTIVVLAVCWAAPVAEQITHHPGNFVQIARSAEGRRADLGARGGWHALAHTVGIPPWWLQHAPSPTQRLADVAPAPAAGTAVSALVVLAGLAVLVAVSMRRGRRDLALACVLALVLCGAVALDAGATPTDPFLFLSIGYTLWWASIAGMFAWLALVWSLVSLLALDVRVARLPRAASAAASGVALAAGVVVALTAGAGENQLRPLFRPMRSISARLEATVPRGRMVTVESSGAGSAFDHRYDVAAAAVYTLRRHGARPLAAGMAPGFGSWYAPRAQPSGPVVRVSCSGAAGRRLGSAQLPGPCPVVVSLSAR